MDVQLDSLMSVLNGTQEDERGVFLDGALFPSKTALRSDGTTRAALMSDKSMVQVWHQAAMDKYAKEDEERNFAASKKDAPELVIGGDDTPTPVDRGGTQPIAEAYATIEEELQAREVYTREQFVKEQNRYYDQARRVEEIIYEHEKILAAMKALGLCEEDSDNGPAPETSTTVGRDIPAKDGNRGKKGSPRVGKKNSN